MFRRILLLSGAIATAATLAFYFLHAVPHSEPVADGPGCMTVKLAGMPERLAEGTAVRLSGTVMASGHTLLGKLEAVIAAGEDGPYALCTFAYGQPSKALALGETVTVVGAVSSGAGERSGFAVCLIRCNLASSEQPEH